MLRLITGIVRVDVFDERTIQTIVIQIHSNNVMMFFMNSDLNSEQQEFCRINKDCGKCGRCEDGLCVYDDGPIPVRSASNPNNQPACVPCEYSKYGGTINSVYRSECQRCSNRFFAGTGLNGGCYLCDRSGIVYSYVRRSDCLACGNRIWTTYAGKVADDGERLGTCSLCVGTVSEDGTQCIMP